MAAGLDNEAVMIGTDLKLYRWLEASKEWKDLGSDSAQSVTSAMRGRMYKVDLAS